MCFTLFELALSWLESLSVVPAHDGFVSGFVVGEAVVGGVPAEFLAGEAGGFDGEQGGLGDAGADSEGRPQQLLVAEAAVDPIAPMIARGDFGHRLVGNLFAFAEDFHFAARLEQQRAFGAND